MDTSPLYYQQIIKRLQVLKTCILDGDLASADRYLNYLPDDLLQQFPVDSALKSKQYGAALQHLESALKNCTSQLQTMPKTPAPALVSAEQNDRIQATALNLYEDPKLVAMAFDIRMVKYKLEAINAAREELEKQLRQFELQQRQTLGGLILQILDAQRRLLRRQSETDPSSKSLADEAEQDYKKYEEQVLEAKEALVFDLDATQQKELKQQYRKASKLCHPDLVEPSFIAQAKVVFMELKQAYQQNNLAKVNHILNSLIQNNLARHRTDTITKKHLLQNELNRLERQLKEAQATLELLKNDETYQNLSNIENWDSYFANTQKQLEQQLVLLEEELENEATDDDDWL